MEKETIVVTPTRRHSRKHLFKNILIGIGFFAVIEMIYPIVKPFRTQALPFLDGAFLGISLFIILYFSFKRICQSIEINYEKKELKIKYIVLFKNDCEIIIPFKKLKYEYFEAPTRQGGKWTLKLQASNRTKFTLAINEYGFDKEKLDFVSERLRSLVGQGPN